VACLAVSFPTLGAPLKTVDRPRESQAPDNGAAAEHKPVADTYEHVCLGRAIPGCELKIADSSGAAIGGDWVGRVLIRGSNVTAGYYSREGLRREAIDAGGWLDTGDLGFLADGELFITGRAKDILFVNGQNFYLHDLEDVAARHPLCASGKVIAGAARRSDAEADDVLLFILHRGSAQDFAATAVTIKQHMTEQLGFPLTHVLPIRQIPKTTSGKLQRHLLAERYLNGEFDEVIAALSALAERPDGNGARASAPVEEQLKQLCDSVLGRSDYSVHDSLFDVCGSSLALAQIHERIDAAFPGKLEITELFDYPTIAKLAKQIESKLAK
jgi:hypothetical protein